MNKRIIPCVTIVIVNYNSKELLRPLVDSINRSSSRYSFEIIIVDNHSSDGSKELILNEIPDVIFIENSRNIGYAAAVNRGIRCGTGKYFFILNPDVQLCKGTLDKMVNYMENHNDVGALGCKIINPDGTIQLSGKTFPTIKLALYHSFGIHHVFPRNRTMHRYYLFEKDYNRTYEVDHLMGSALMVRKEAIDKAGLLDEKFFLYFEDVDWCWRIKQRGYKVVYFPDAIVIHEKGACTRKESFRAIKIMHSSMWYFYKKYFASKYPWWLNELCCFGLWARKCIYLIINCFAIKKKVYY